MFPLPEPESRNFLLTKSSLGDLIKKRKNEEYSIENELWTCDPKINLPIVLENKNPDLPITLLDAFKDLIKKAPLQEILEHVRNGKVEKYSAIQLFDSICSFSKSLISHNIDSRQVINIIGDSSPEWFIAFYGSIFAGLIPIPIHSSSSSEFCTLIANESQASVLLVDKKSNFDKFLRNSECIENFKLIIFYEDEITENKQNELELKKINFPTFISLGKISGLDSHLQARMNSVTPESCVIIIYTSGITGTPKGVLLSHDNLTWTFKKISKRFNFEFGNEVILSYLPLSNIAGILIDIISPVMSGSMVVFKTKSLASRNLIFELRRVKPTIFLSFPRIWESFHDLFEIWLKNQNLISRKFLQYALKQGENISIKELNNESLLYKERILKKTLFMKIRRFFGLENAKHLIVGGPLLFSIRKYFISLNIMISESYGITECSGPVTFNHIHIKGNQFKYKNSKLFEKPLEGMNYKLVDINNDGVGELYFKGRNRFMGYLKDSQLTNQAIKENGYFSTGDLAVINNEWFIKITGRKQELIKLANGEIIPPLLIENDIISEISFISEAFIIGNKRQYLIALLILKSQSNGDLPLDIQHKFAVQTVSEVKHLKSLHKLIHDGIRKVNRRALSRSHLIRKWAIIEINDRKNYPEHSTSNLSKRQSIENLNGDIIESLYQDPKF